MHINKNHWALLVLNFIKKEVQLLNSLASTRDENQEKALVSTTLHVPPIQLQLQFDQI